jgi:hypothetical protein
VCRSKAALLQERVDGGLGDLPAVLPPPSHGTTTQTSTTAPLPPESPTTTLPDGGPRPKTCDDCKKGGWQRYGVFRNQGDCVSWVATHGKNEPGKNEPGH